MPNFNSNNDNIIVIDTLGLVCPIPVLKLQKKIKEIPTGGKIQLISDDSASRIDVPHYCNESKNKLLNIKVSKDQNFKKSKFEFLIQKN